MLLSQPKDMNKLPREGMNRPGAQKYSLSAMYLQGSRRYASLLLYSFLSHSLCLLVNLKFKPFAARLALTMWFVQSLAQ